MSCFTVNKLIGAVSGKASPSPKRKQKSVLTCVQGIGNNKDKPEVIWDRDDDVYTSCNGTNQEITLMKEEIQSLTTKLGRVSSERDFFESTINRLQLEKLRLVKDRDDQLDSQSSRYEERLVELHSVIAELSRQLEQKVRDRISEDEEEDDYGDGEQEKKGKSNQGVGNDDHESSQISEMASRTSTDIDAQAVEAGAQLLGEIRDLSYPDMSFFRLTTSASVSRTNSTNSVQVLALQEELSDAKERILQLNARMQQKESDLAEARRLLEAEAAEKVSLRARITELEQLKKSEPTCSKCRLLNNSPKQSRMKSNVTKVAERRRLESVDIRTEEFHSDEDFDNDSTRKLSSAEIKEVNNRIVAEHLVRSIREDSSMPEIVCRDNNDISRLLEDKIREFEYEMERMSAKIEHLRSQNDVLSLNLQESKDHCDDLTVLIGKYESNHTAHQLLHCYNDHITDAQNILLALLETELRLTMVQCHMLGFDPEHPEEKTQSAPEVQEVLRAHQEAKSFARRQLTKLEDEISRPDSGFSSGTNTGRYMASWRDLASSPNETSQDESSRLRELVTRLKNMKASISSTIVDLGGLHAELEDIPCNNIESVRNESRTADLELAVLVQELMAMREEKNDLRATVFHLEREKKAMELLINSQQAQEMALKSHIRQIQRDLRSCKKEGSETSFDDDRESRDEMRLRITELLQSLEKVKRNSELRYQQQDEVIKDLKRTNEHLTETLDRTKKKYQTKLRRLEQQILQPLMKKQFGKNFDINSQSIHSAVSTETDQTSE